MKLLLLVLLLGTVKARESCSLSFAPGEITCNGVIADVLPIKEVLSFEEDIQGFTISLRRLEFHDSQIASIRKNTFKLLPRLTQLILSNISLESIDVQAFQGITRLKSLDLSFNKLTILHKDLFQGIVLLHLRLDGNQNLEKPTNGPFINAPWLHSLSLRKCNITHLPGSAFSATPDLNSLVLSHNYLEQLPVDIFKTLSLIHLDLSHNRFKTIDPQVFMQIRGFPKLPNVVILTGNHWHCDCSMSSVIAWATQDTVTHYPTTNMERSRLKKETTCATPFGRRGHSWIRYDEWKCHEKQS